MRREVWERFKDYERPDFHPNDRDSTALVETWRAELFSDGGSLAPLVTGLPGLPGLRGPNAETPNAETPNAETPNAEHPNAQPGTR
jgi:hypothetical protein